MNADAAPLTSALTPGVGGQEKNQKHREEEPSRWSVKQMQSVPRGTNENKGFMLFIPGQTADIYTVGRS